jgi:hypothetical protein
VSIHFEDLFFIACSQQVSATKNKIPPFYQPPPPPSPWPVAVADLPDHSKIRTCPLEYIGALQALENPGALTSIAGIETLTFIHKGFHPFCCLF